MPRKTTMFPSHLSELLKTFRNEVSAILKGKFVALYVFGSLAMDDFSEHQSDIDFLVLISKPLSDTEGKRLQALHEKLRATRFGDKLEGEYVEISALHAEGVKGTVARCERGILKLKVRSEISAENILDLRQNSYALYGPNPKTIIPPVPCEAVNKVMQGYLKELNEELKHAKPKSLNWLSSRVLDICRTLYTLQTGRVTSKSAGARWALRVLSPKWKPLICRSLAVRHGNGGENDKAFIAIVLPQFVSYALDYHSRHKSSKCRRESLG